MRGDALASGSKTATFGPPKVSKEKWASIWAEETPAELKARIKRTYKLSGMIEAIKEYRLATGAGLIEAKNYVDDLRGWR